MYAIPGSRHRFTSALAVLGLIATGVAVQATATATAAPAATTVTACCSTTARPRRPATPTGSSAPASPTRQQNAEPADGDATGPARCPRGAWPCRGRAVQLKTLPAGNTITYGTGGALDLKNFDTFVLAEPNIRLRRPRRPRSCSSCRTAAGCSSISDHTGSDRNNDGWDSPRSSTT